MSEALAIADFRLTGTGWNNRPVDETVHAELHKSGAFDYGNGTCTVLTWNGRKGFGREEVYDTRYSNVTTRNFKKFVKELLENNVMDTVKVETIS